MNLFGKLLDNQKKVKKKHEPVLKRITFSPDQDIEIFLEAQDLPDDKLNSPHFPKTVQNVFESKFHLSTSL
jgi:hypothetical protein